MSVDISRVRFDPLADFSGVVLQQGRLLLDADFNEYVAILDRRLRAESCDLTSPGPVSGHQGVAWVPRLTPDGFRVSATGGKLTIGRGRMYVDGLLAENHGAGVLAFGPLLAEEAGTQDVDFADQPYWPGGPATPEGGGPYLAFLDVWQREVTHLQDPALVEVAVGVDTTARTQTVWQVRLLEVPSSVSCSTDDDDIPGWPALVSPSAGRLSTDTVEFDDDDPCELPPSGGFRGRENQTYRVEIHDGGAPGTATFKWSRDQGSVAQPVVEVTDPKKLRMASLGPDDVLNLAAGQWVEVLDDHREFAREPGAVVRIDAVHTATLQIDLKTALPADLQLSASDAAARHLRMRRWDQAKIVRDGTGAQITDLDAAGSTGLVTVPASGATQVLLESGVVVSFSLAAGGSGEFHPGDHWVFAARTADTSVEHLDAAPPLGIHHHYARLGVVDLPDSETDCRRLWPPEQVEGDDCACTVCVTTEEGSISLQEAIEQVRRTGGTICVTAGVHEIPDGVIVEEARSVRIVGQGPATVLVARDAAITVRRSLGITIENMAIVAGAGSRPAILLETTVATTLERLAVLSYRGDGGASDAAVGVRGLALALTVCGNVLVGASGIAVDEADDAKAGVLAAGLRIAENIVAGSVRGIAVGHLSMYLKACRICSNEVLGGQEAGIVADGALLRGGLLEVSDNTVTNAGAGIVVGPDASVTGNVIAGTGDPAQDAKFFGDGILVRQPDLGGDPGAVQVLANRISAKNGAGVRLATTAQRFAARDNVVSEVLAGITMTGKGSAAAATVAGNDVRAVDDRRGLTVGILTRLGEKVAVEGNTLTDIGRLQADRGICAGIAAVGGGDVRVSANQLSGLGQEGETLVVTVGVIVGGAFEHALVTENAVRPTVTPQGRTRWHALAVVETGQELLQMAPAMPVLAGKKGILITAGAFAFFVAPRRNRATINANVLEGGGEFPTCRVAVSADVIADANHCQHSGSPEAMVLRGSAITASTNRLVGGDDALVLDVAGDRFAAVGNLAPMGVHLGSFSNPVPAPWNALNPAVF